MDNEINSLQELYNKLLPVLKTKVNEMKLRNIDYIDEILSLLIEKDKALEINSAGLRKNLSTPNPDLFVIKRYKELGGSLITVGSDSHDSTNIAYGFNLVANLLLEAGFKHYNIYINRTPYEKELV